MARTTYPGLTATENRRAAKYDYTTSKRSPVRTCIVLYSDWCVTAWNVPGDVGSGVKKDYHVHHIKDAHTGRLLDIDTRKGGDVTRRAPVQMSWFH